MNIHEYQAKALLKDFGVSVADKPGDAARKIVEQVQKNANAGGV